MPTVWYKENGIRKPMTISQKAYRDFLKAKYWANPVIPGGGLELSEAEKKESRDSGGVSGPGTGPLGGEGFGGPGIGIDAVGPEGGQVPTGDLVSIIGGLLLGQNPFGSVLDAALGQFKGEHALTMNSVPQTGWNLLSNALGLHAGMDPSVIGDMQAIANAHSINEALAEMGYDPALGMPSPFGGNYGGGLSPSYGGGGYGMPGGEGVGGLW